MGFDLENTEAMAGAIYMGQGMEWIYTLIAAVFCVYVLWAGNRHEHNAYKKLKK